MLLVKILVSASPSQTANYLFLNHHLHSCSTLLQRETCRTRGRDANLFHSSSLKRPRCNAAKKHVAFGVTGVMRTFSQLERISFIAVAIDVASHNWAECVTFSPLWDVERLFRNWYLKWEQTVQVEKKLIHKKSKVYHFDIVKTSHIILLILDVVNI